MSVEKQTLINLKETENTLPINSANSQLITICINRYKRSDRLCKLTQPKKLALYFSFNVSLTASIASRAA